MDAKGGLKINPGNVSANIEPFFTKEELEKMSDYEKSHLKNLRSNYEALLLIGLYPEKPNFMKSAKEKKKIEKILEQDEEEEDEEWLPSYKKKRPLPECKTKASVKKPKAEIPKFQKRKLVKQISCETIPRVLREKPANCMSLEVPADDTFIYCEDCNEEYFNNCPTHGPLITIADTEVKMRISNYAEKTAPVCVMVKESSIPNAGLGVFAKEPIPNRTRFGPYKGEITRNEDKAQISGYSWQIYSDGKPSHFIDAHDPMTSNWMRFVNCARNEDEQNLTAFQFVGEIYYKTLRPVSRGEELLVWYGEEYAKDLGICSLESRRSEQKKQNPKNIDVTGALSEVLTPKVNDICQDKSNWKEAERQALAFVNKKADEQKMKKQNCQKVSKAEGYTKRIKIHTRNKGEKPFQCEVCLKTFTVNGSLKLHMMIHRGEKPFQCEVCLKTFTENGNLKRHLKIHREEKPFQCEVCLKTFTQNGDLKRHMMIHRGEKPFQCEVCMKTFTVNGSLKLHMMIHRGEKPFQCELCLKTFTLNGDLKRHMMIHRGEKPFQCKVCLKTFTRNRSLKLHMMIHRGEKPFQCEVCLKTFAQKVHFNEHMMIHRGEKPFQCEVCLKAFTQNGHLNKHMMIHRGEKPFQCEVCLKTFTQNGHLNQHMMIHRGKKPFQCEVCLKTFAQKVHFNEHMMIHRGEKPFQCEVCLKAFTRNGHLNEHMMIHRGEKPFQCEVCLKTFTRNGHLNQHMMIHRGEKPFQCEVCLKTFTQNGHLNQHMIIHRGKEAIPV